MNDRLSRVAAVLFWPLFGAAQFGGVTVARRLAGLDAPLLPLLWPYMFWLQWGALTPFLMRFVRRYPTGGARLRRNIGLHVLLFISICVAQMIVNWTIRYAITGALLDAPIPLRHAIVLKIPAVLFVGLLVYVSTVAVSQHAALDRALNEEALGTARLRAAMARMHVETATLRVEPDAVLRALDAISALSATDARAAEAELALLSKHLRETLRARPPEIEQAVPDREQVQELADLVRSARRFSNLVLAGAPVGLAVLTALSAIATAVIGVPWHDVLRRAGGDGGTWLLLAPIVPLTLATHDRLRSRLAIAATTAGALLLWHALMAMWWDWAYGIPVVNDLHLLTAWWSGDTMLEIMIVVVIVICHSSTRVREREHVAVMAHLQAEERRQSERFRFLAAQLQPHFLFGALNSILALLHEDAAGARKMIAELRGFLSAAFCDARVTVPLRDEVVVLSHYLAIEKRRFDERLDVRIDIGEDAMDCAIPPFILQPLVENSLRHGLADGSGTIIVRGRREAARLRLDVEDSGEVAPHELCPREGIGLGNTRERLRLLYGDAASLELTRTARETTLVALSIPVRRAS